MIMIDSISLMHSQLSVSTKWPLKMACFASIGRLLRLKFSVKVQVATMPVLTSWQSHVTWAKLFGMVITTPSQQMTVYGIEKRPSNTLIIFRWSLSLTPDDSGRTSTERIA